MAGLFDILGGLGLNSTGDQGDAPMSRLGLAAGNADRAPQPPATPEWGFGDPSNGDPLFGQQNHADDKEIDPDTGLSKGFLRRENNKQTMLTGLMLLAAGTSRDDGARAQILSGIANNDSSSRIQNYAKMRLDLARGRLADQQAKSQAAQDAAFQQQFGGGTQAPQGAPAAPASAPMLQPGPVAGAVGPQAAPAAAAVAAGTGNAADAAIATAATSGAPPAPAQPPQAAPTPDAPPAPPTSVLGGPGRTVLPGKAPDKMDIPGALATYVPTAQEKQEILSMGREKGLAEVARRTDALRNQEYPGSPIMVEGTNQVQIPIYQHGALKGYKEAGAGTTSASIEKDPNTGDSVLVTRDGRGNKTGISAYDGANEKDQRRISEADAAAATASAADLTTKRASLATLGQQYSRLDLARKDIEAGKVDSGPATEFKNYLKRVADSVGALSADEKAQIMATSNVEGLTNELAGKLAKAQNGSQVTGPDFDNAKREISGGGTPMEFRAALSRQMEAIRSQASQFNDDVQRHNDLLGSVKAGAYVTGKLRVKPLEGDFGTRGDANSSAFATEASGTPQAPNAPTTPLGLLGRAMKPGVTGQPDAIEGAPSVAGTVPKAPSAAGAAPPVTISDAAGYHKLPSGTHYIDPNGTARIKP